MFIPISFYGRKFNSLFLLFLMLFCKLVLLGTAEYTYLFLFGLIFLELKFYWKLPVILSLLNLKYYLCKMKIYWLLQVAGLHNSEKVNFRLNRSWELCLKIHSIKNYKIEIRPYFQTLSQYDLHSVKGSSNWCMHKFLWHSYNN